MRGNPQADRRAAGADQGRQRAIARARQDQGQSTRPEPGREPLGRLVPVGERAGGLAIRDVDDQGVEARPALGREDRGDRALVGRDPAQAVDRLGREGDQAAAVKGLRRALDVGRGAAQTLAHERIAAQAPASARQPMSRRQKPSGQSIRSTAA